LFSAATALQFQLPTLGVNVPIIMLPYLLALLAVGGLAGRQTAPRALARICAGKYPSDVIAR
jgi:simple sugar transport system permease protein